MRPLQVITFDLDDTLWELAPALVLAERTTRAFLAQHAPDMAQRFDGPALQALRAELVAGDPALAHQLSRMRRETYYVGLQRSGYSDREAARLANAAFTVFIDGRHAVQPYAGVEGLLAELALQYRLGALSNGNADLRRVAIGAHFSFHFSAEQVGAAKPHPALFEAALAHAGVAASAMLHVGDNAEHDVLGASRAGIASVWVNNKGEAFPEALGVRPVASVRSVLQLPEVLDALR